MNFACKYCGIKFESKRRNTKSCGKTSCKNARIKAYQKKYQVEYHKTPQFKKYQREYFKNILNGRIKKVEKKVDELESPAQNIPPHCDIYKDFKNVRAHS